MVLAASARPLLQTDENIATRPGRWPDLIHSDRRWARHVKGRCGTPLRFVSSLAFGNPWRVWRSIGWDCQRLSASDSVSCAIRARVNGKWASWAVMTR